VELSIYLWSITKQVILTYIDNPRPLIPDGDPIIVERDLRRERSQTDHFMPSAKPESIWYHLNFFFKTSLVLRSESGIKRGGAGGHVD